MFSAYYQKSRYTTKCQDAMKSQYYITEVGCQTSLLFHNYKSQLINEETI